MEQKLFSLTIAGCSIPCRFLYEDTALQFECYCTEAADGNSVVELSQEEVELAKKMYPEELSLSTVEFNELTARISEILLQHKRCVFHGLAFLWREKAWIFSGYSGVGKTTQYIRWKMRYGEEIQILNGDKPVLECCSDGKIMVHSSPWNGKEVMGRKGKAPLGGIIYLQQGKENRIRRLTAAEAIAPLFSQFLFLAETEQAVRQACAIEEKILQYIPVWLLINLGDDASARLTHDTLEAFEENGRTDGCLESNYGNKRV